MEETYTCCITGELMEDPVIAADGHSYERVAIENWFQTRDTSPLTGLPVPRTLIPNHALRNAIQLYKAEQERATSALLVANATTNGQQREGQMRSDPHQLPHDRVVPSVGVTLASAPSTIPLVPADNILAVNVTPTEIDDQGNSLKGTVISLCLPPDARPKPLYLIAVLDVSGSMTLLAQEQSFVAEATAQFSRLDLVKHSMNTAIELLRDSDYLTLIAFNSDVKILLEQTPMTREGRRRAKDAINRMKPEGTTNLWGGLHTGVQQAQKLPDIIRDQQGHCAILLLTDGQPSREYVPQRGISESLRRSLAQHPTACPLTIHCCGYGYKHELDTPLLCDIAEIGRGTYSYVPDGSMVGTVFIHLICNLLSVVFSDVTVDIKLGPETTCRFATGPQEASRQIYVGALRAAQTKSIFLPLVGAGPAKIEIVRVSSSRRFVPTIRYLAVSRSVMVEHLRFWFVDSLSQTIDDAWSGNLTGAHSIVRKLHDKLAVYASEGGMDQARLLREDLIHSSAEKGQVFKAIESKDCWDKWGQHYLPSILFAHQRQEKSNFKDQSMTIYSTPMLEAEIDRAEDVFASLPPPTPSIKVFNYYGGGGGGDGGMGLDMRALINRQAGCFTADSLVKLYDGSSIRMDQLVKGTILFGGFKVRCVVRFACEESLQYVIRGKGIGITAYHPFVHPITTLWTFPVDAMDVFDICEYEICECVFNLVLDGGHTCVVGDGFECVTLGHGFSGDPVVEHEYFGTDRVISDLRRMSGFEDGLVEFKRPIFSRDPVTARVNGISETLVEIYSTSQLRPVRQTIDAYHCLL